MSEHQVVGLDGEMTGGTKTLDFYKEYQLCQIGVALSYDDVFTSDIGFDEGKYKVTEEALEVNKFTHERIQSGLRQEQVDSDLVRWIRGRIPAANTPFGLKLIATGWNVASWDLPFVRFYLPRFSEWLWYRTIDLNAVVFAAEKVTGKSYKSIKDAAKRYAEKVIKPPADWHNAGYDAAASLAAWHYLIKFLTPKVSWTQEHDDL